LNTTGLKTPYVLKAEWTDSSGSNRMYSIAEGNNYTNINPISDTAVTGASENDDPDDLYDKPDPDRYSRSKIKFREIVDQLRVVLAPLFALYETTKDPVSDELDDDNTGLKALFKDVKIKQQSGMVIVTNKRTNGVIYEAPLSNIASGTFHPENMPGTPGQINGATLYANNCASCHDPLTASTKKGATAAQIQAAIDADTGGMGSLANLTALQVQAIASVLTSTSTTPPPSACTYSYDAWSACQSNGTQTRNLLSSSPPGCTGTPVLSQACTYVPPVTACTSFTYSAWGTCSNGTQTRTVLTSLPAGCTGGTPALSQSCTPPVTACTSFTYNVWGACQSNNTQTRTVATSLPAGCTGGTPSLSQACTYIPPTLPGKAVYDNSCSGCHRLGTYDATGSAPNLSSKGSLVGTKYTAGIRGHNGITLSATQMTDVTAFLNAN
jgi:mono/diheme cytochrome c family protein